MDQNVLPLIVAHRGYASRYPENTIEACQAAVDAGARWVEVDVQMHDGELLLAHDLPLSGHETPLALFAEWLHDHPDVAAFVELKKASLANHGQGSIVFACLDVMRGNWHPISFDYDALALAVLLGSPEPGWIVCRYDDQIEAAARRLGARWLVTNRDFLAPGPVPSGWEWMVYEVGDLETARDLIERGVTWLETMNVAELIEGLRDGSENVQG